MLKAKWLIYTVLIGLLPFLIRLFFYFVTTVDSSFLMNEGDFVVFGLVLSLTNLNELEHRKQSIWKTKMIGGAAVQVAFYASILGLSYASEVQNQTLVNPNALFVCALGVALFSFLFSYSIYNKLSKVDKHE